MFTNFNFIKRTGFGLNLYVRDRKGAIVGVCSTNQLRLTHRLSLKERERRIDFVRQKHLLKMMTVLGMQMGYNPLLARMPNNAVTYNKGKIRVSGILLASWAYTEMPFKKEYDILFETYWKLDVRLRMFSRLMKQYRRFFGAQVMDSEELKLTPKGCWEIVSFLNFNKPFYALPEYRQDLIKLLNPLPWIKTFYNHPAWSIFLQRFKSMIDFKIYVSSHRGVLDSSTDQGPFAKDLISKVPTFDGSLLGERKLSARQVARLKNRKERFRYLYLWHMLWKGPVIQRSLSITHKLKIVSAFSLTDHFVYCPHYNIVCHREYNTPMIKFATPVAIKNWRFISRPRLGWINVDDLVASYQYNHDVLNNYKRLRKYETSLLIKRLVG